MNFSLQKITAFFVLIVVLTVIMMEAAMVLKPMAFALIAASIYYKPVHWFEKKGFNQFWSVATTMLLGSVIFIGFGYFIVAETYQVMSSLKSELNLENPSETIIESVNERLPGDLFNMDKQQASETFRKWINDFGIPFISTTFKSTGYFTSNALLALIYTFFILLYRKGIARVFSRIQIKGFEKGTVKMIRKMAKTGQQYASGLVLLVISLSVLYAITFWLFGISYPLIFAIIAASLAIIPYIGTTLGASLPVIYAYLSYDNHFIALGLIICIFVIQSLEGNILTPKIVGGNMKLNPLTALVAVVIGNFIWGLAGMILFLPLTAMLRIIFDEFDGLKSLADLSGKEITKVR